MDIALPSVVAMDDVSCVGSTEGAAAAPSDAGTVLAMEHEDPLLSFSSDEEEEDAAGQLALLAEVAEEEDGAVPAWQQQQKDQQEERTLTGTLLMEMNAREAAKAAKLLLAHDVCVDVVEKIIQSQELAKRFKR